MKGRALIVLSLLVFMLVASMAAQLDSGNVIRRLRVRLAFENETCEPSTLVLLMGNAGPVAEAAPNDRCEVEFINVPIGSYTLHISGVKSANFEPDRINLTALGSTEFEVKVNGPNEPNRSYGGRGNSSVSTSELAIPSRARREFDKANALAGNQDFTQAIQKLNKAISIYPAYAMAYNNLAVIYARLGEVAREREALEKAISINDHLALAYVNLARMNLISGDFKKAQTALGKASTLDPRDPMALILLSYAEFRDQRFDQAIATVRRAHTMEANHAFAHRVAARVFERQGQGASAMAELDLFLKEAPADPGADSARQELEMVKAALR